MQTDVMKVKCSSIKVSLYSVEDGRWKDGRCKCSADEEEEMQSERYDTYDTVYLTK